MRTLSAAALAFALLFAVSPGTQSPQTAPGVLAGTVTGADGVPLAGALVELATAARVVKSVATQADGTFEIRDVAAGIYELRVTAAGYVPSSRMVTVSDRAQARLSIPLRPAAPLAAELAAELAARQDIAASRVAASKVAALGQISAAAPSAPMPGAWFGPAAFNTEAYDRIVDNRFLRATEHALSTFSIDVDTASYSNIRRFLNEGTLPPADAVRVEEMINYFHYDYDAPADGKPFSVTTEVAACPWDRSHRLALIGLHSRPIEAGRMPPRNLVFLLDVSGSMASPDKLPLVQTAMRMLVDTLTEQDRVAIVVYAGASGLVLPSTPGSDRQRIQQAIADLRPGGSTNGAAGIRLAYDTAAEAFRKEGINRVILATDGDFNVGVTSQGELLRLIEQERTRGIFLSVLGVGTGNLKDSTMEKLADTGNGNYGYIDSLHEARRILVAEAGATLVTVAKDVKIQVEFNPRTVGAYRLIGYENRLLAKEDFNDDRKDAGEIGAGHSVTALYEIVPPGEPVDGGSVDPLKYQSTGPATSAAGSGELMTVKLRYKQPNGETSQLLSVAVADRQADPGPRLGFAAAVAEFGMLLRDSEYKGASTWERARALGRQHRGEDPAGYRAEMLRMIDLAASLSGRETTPPQVRR
jgi:Ca-activated chloride channel family protein